MTEKYTARVIVGNKYVGEKITAEFKGTLQEIVDWAQTDKMYDFSRQIDLSEFIAYPDDVEEAHQWFTLRPLTGALATVTRSLSPIW